MYFPLAVMQFLGFVKKSVKLAVVVQPLCSFPSPISPSLITSIKHQQVSGIALNSSVNWLRLMFL